MILNEQFFEYLIEKRCLACYPYLDTLQDIVNYSKNYIKENKCNRGYWEFQIPLEITKKIGIFKELHITIHISNIFSYTHREDVGAAETTIEMFNYLEINNGQFVKPINITIYGYAENGVLYEHTLYANLSHELNHKIEQLFRSLNPNEQTKYNSINPLYLQAACHQEIKNVIFSNDLKSNNYLHMILYRLFETTELNALISQVAPELLAAHTNDKKDIEKTSPYLFLQYMKNNLDLLNDENINWKLLFDTINGKVIWKNENKEFNLEKFKKDFKNKLDKRINYLEDKIKQSASLYFENIVFTDKDKKLENGQIYIY